MRYKTIIRLALRVMGVYFLASAVIQIGHQMPMFINMGTGQFRGSVWGYAGAFGGIAARLLVGGYLFLGGRLLLDLMIPASRPYCHECGYDLSGAPTAGICPECGTAYHRTRGPLDSTRLEATDMHPRDASATSGTSEASSVGRYLAKKDQSVEDRARSDQSDNR